jgi:hypothetical protein
MTAFARALLAVAASLAAAALVAWLIGESALALVRAAGPRDTVLLTGILANLAAVPLVAGFTLGVIARRWLPVLSVALVVASLLGTYWSLGPTGLPHGWKLVEYGLQLALVYLAARWGAATWRARATSSERPA